MKGGGITTIRWFRESATNPVRSKNPYSFQLPGEKMWKNWKTLKKKKHLLEKHNFVPVLFLQNSPKRSVFSTQKSTPRRHGPPAFLDAKGQALHGAVDAKRQGTGDWAAAASTGAVWKPGKTGKNRGKTGGKPGKTGENWKKPGENRGKTGGKLGKTARKRVWKGLDWIFVGRISLFLCDVFVWKRLKSANMICWGRFFLLEDFLKRWFICCCFFIPLFGKEASQFFFQSMWVALCFRFAMYSLLLWRFDWLRPHFKLCWSCARGALQDSMYFVSVFGLKVHKDHQKPPFWCFSAPSPTKTYSKTNH